MSSENTSSEYSENMLDELFYECPPCKIIICNSRIQAASTAIHYLAADMQRNPKIISEGIYKDVVTELGEIEAKMNYLYEELVKARYKKVT